MPIRCNILFFTPSLRGEEKNTGFLFMIITIYIIKKYGIYKPFFAISKAVVVI